MVLLSCFRCSDWIHYSRMGRQMVCREPGAGGKTTALLGNPETRRITRMQADYYWLKVTSCPPPLPESSSSSSSSPNPSSSSSSWGWWLQSVWRLLCRLKAWQSSTEKKQGTDGKAALLLSTREGRDARQIKTRLSVRDVALKIVPLLKTL